MNDQRITKMCNQLEAALQPTVLEIVDESHKHVGHPGAQDGRGHFAVHIHSPLFHNRTRVQCHRLIYQALAELMQTDIHALRIIIR